MPPLGYLTAATVLTHLGDQLEVSDSDAKNAILVGWILIMAAMLWGLSRKYRVTSAK